MYCAPFDVTDLEFQVGEHITSIAAGDTLRWQVSRSYSGDGDTYQEHILLKPTDPDLQNSLVVTTDMRTYHIQLHSTQDTYMSAVQWTYPKTVAAQQMTYVQTQQQVLNGLNLTNLTFDYQWKLESGPTPDWMPAAVFTDGAKTYIQFPKGVQNAPLLFIGRSPDSDRIINYRVIGDYYVIDAVIESAQLRLGQHDVSVVQIDRQSS